MKRIILNVSGGIDSSALLKKYIHDTDYHVIAHKIFYGIGHGSERQKKEMEALDKFVAKLQSVRRFEYIKTLVKFPLIPKKTLDIPNLAMLTIQLAQAKWVDEVYFGFISDKEGQDERIKKMLNIFNGWHKDFAELNDSWELKTDELFKVSEFHSTKKEYIKILNEDVMLTWFCRGDRTLGFKWEKPCGKCHTCMHVKKSLEEILSED
jgi:7-cyano-7-deazaguanine synthase in queuosine biosynthesis